MRMHETHETGLEARMQLGHRRTSGEGAPARRRGATARQSRDKTTQEAQTVKVTKVSTIFLKEWVRLTKSPSKLCAQLQSRR